LRWSRSGTPRKVTEERRGPDYRRAAELAVEQLDWCIAYLRRIRMDKIASQLSRNRDHIVRSMQGERRR
jgi:hypothetical protein